MNATLLCRARRPLASMLTTALCVSVTHQAVAQVVIHQLTNDAGGAAGNSTANPSAGGAYTAFESNRDFTGGNPELNSEIFLHVAVVGTRQITGCPGGNSRIPSLSSAPLMIAFTSTCDLTGQNPDGNAELFVGLDLFTQVTNTTGLGVLAVDMSANSVIVAFLSDGNFTEQNADGNVELFWHNRTTQEFKQLTNSTGINNSGGLSMDTTGHWIAFPSRNDLTGGNPQLNTEIFLADATTGALTQITSTVSDGSISPTVALRNEAPVVAFVSTFDPGNNPERNQEIFLWDGGVITQITNTGAAVFNDTPSIDEGGTRIAFSSNGNLTGQNGDLSGEIFVYDTVQASFLQVTNVQAPGSFPHGPPSMAPSGVVISFVSSADLTGENNDRGPEIFRAITHPSICSPTAFRKVITGTSGDDVILGTPVSEHILGLGGNDRIIGGDGNDCIDGGDGNDRLIGAKGNDLIYGGAGDDVLAGQDGNDRLDGEAGQDTLHGGAGTDVCRAEAGEQVVACEG
jgi:Ca2+-binding RTX toxin-like protein